MRALLTSIRAGLCQAVGLAAAGVHTVERRQFMRRRLGISKQRPSTSQKRGRQMKETQDD